MPHAKNSNPLTIMSKLPQACLTAFCVYGGPCPLWNGKISEND